MSQTDKTPAAKSIYRSLVFDNDIWHCFLSVLSFYDIFFYLSVTAPETIDAAVQAKLTWIHNKHINSTKKYKPEYSMECKYRKIASRVYSG